MRKLSELASLRGRAALITGAAGHIGRAVCDALMELGSEMIVLDRAEDACLELAGELADRWGRPVRAVVLDLEGLEGAGLAERLLGGGRLDVLVNCASFVGTMKLEGWNVPFEAQSAATWRRALDVSLTAPFILTRELAGALKSSGHGSVINFGSIYGLLGPDVSLYEGTEMHNAAAYGAAKAGLLQLTRYMATVFAPGIRVNSVTPGGILRGQPESFVERYCARTPMRRMGAEEDLKGAVAYLAGDLSSYVTGHNLVVDGGWSAW